MRIDITELREQLLRNDNQILSQLSEKYGGYCISYLCGKHDCEKDQAQDLFVEAILQFRDRVVQGKLEKVANIKSYLLGTCLNLFKMELRKSRRSDDKQTQIQNELYAEEQNHLEQIIDREQTDELHELTLKSFSQLDEACREILSLFYVQEMSMSEIASATGLANDKVAKTKKSRCYKKWMSLVQEIKGKYYAE